MSVTDDVVNDLKEEFPIFICEKCGTESCIVMRVRQIVVESENGFISKRVGLCIPCFFELGEPDEE